MFFLLVYIGPTDVKLQTSSRLNRGWAYNRGGPNVRKLIDMRLIDFYSDTTSRPYISDPVEAVEQWHGYMGSK